MISQPTKLQRECLVRFEYRYSSSVCLVDSVAVLYGMMDCLVWWTLHAPQWLMFKFVSHMCHDFTHNMQYSVTCNNSTMQMTGCFGCCIQLVQILAQSSMSDTLILQADTSRPTRASVVVASGANGRAGRQYDSLSFTIVSSLAAVTRGHVYVDGEGTREGLTDSHAEESARLKERYIYWRTQCGSMVPTA